MKAWGMGILGMYLWMGGCTDNNEQMKIPGKRCESYQIMEANSCTSPMLSGMDYQDEHFKQCLRETFENNFASLKAEEVTKIKCSDKGIQSVSASILPYFINLEELDLSSNQIAKIEEEAFLGFSSLKVARFVFQPNHYDRRRNLSRTRQS